MQVLLQTETSRLWVLENYGPDLYPYLQNLELEIEPALNRNFGNGPAYMRRDVGFFSDQSVGYRYSNQISKSRPLARVPVFPEFLAQVNASLNTSFNGILVNRYSNGEKYISPHSDDKRGLDPARKMVAALSYGPATRTFRIRDIHTKKIVLDYPHQPRTLLVMEGEFQSQFTHEIPIQKRVKEERISLTFRHHLE